MLYLIPPYIYVPPIQTYPPLVLFWRVLILKKKKIVIYPCEILGFIN